jgi:hypothetical protein
MAEAPSRVKQPGSAFGSAVGSMRRRIDPAIAWAFGCIVLVLLSSESLFEQLPVATIPPQQLKVASFLGVIGPA